MADNSDVAKRALDLFTTRAVPHWQEIYDRAREDLHFLSDDKYAQWNQKDYDERTSTGRPALTIDQLGQFVHQVVNDIRQNTPAINVIPDGDGDIDTSEVYKGLIKNIEYCSNADDVYDTAASNSVKSSVGFIRVDHDYCDDESDEQELLIKRVINPLSVWIDPDSIECDGRDAKFAFIIDKIKVSEFKKLYPGKEVVSFQGDKTTKLKDDDYVQIAEFFELVTEDVKVEGSERSTQKKTVNRYKLSGAEVLESTTFPGKYIPIVPVYGEEAWIDGERHIFSLIRKSKDAQMMYNVWKSLETEIVQKQPQAPVMAAEGQVDDYAEDWKDPSKAMVLRYKSIDAAGNPLPPPQRLSPPSVPAGIVNAARETVDDIKATLGMYNASIGQRSNETSGIAINQRKMEGDVATFHFSDNLVRSITQVGRILVSAIPEIYDTARIIRIIGVEDEPKQIGINGAQAPDQERPFDLNQGKYTVRVITGASYTTQRQETVAALTQMFSANPELMTAFGDIYFKNSDFAGAQAMAERAKKMLPPQLQDSEDGKDVDPEKMQMRMQLQQAQQIIQQGAQEIQSLQAQVQSKQADQQIKVQSDQMKAQNDQTKGQIEIMKLQLEEKNLNLEAQVKAQELELKKMELELRSQELLMGGEEKGQGSEPQESAQTQPTDALAAAIQAMTAVIEQGKQPKVTNIIRQPGPDGYPMIVGAVSE